jgi:hypothetical protein
VTQNASTPTPVPSLTDRQIICISSVMTQLLLSPEFGASFLADPRPPLLNLGMSEDDVVQIVNYFKYVRELVEKDHGDDWVG